MKRNSVWIALALLGACSRNEGPPLSPEASIARMQLEPGYQIARFSAEPDVVAPAAMEWDEDGRVYVVENPGYPLNVEGKVGKVKMLADTNGDGLPDKVTTFADQLTLPTGVMRWKKGILVTDAPDLLYFEDSDGDGRADVKRKILTGFALTNPQHTVNTPVYGLDNWIYIAHENPTTAIVFKDKFGDRGTDIRWADREGAAPLTERGRAIRIRPDEGKIEALAGSSQFGQAFDDWGHHFVLNNTYHARHMVIDARYLRRNPDLPLTSAIEDISDYGRPAKVFPIAPRQRFEMLTNVGEFTSACGLTLFNGSFFVAEPAHNLVHRATFGPAGATFVAKRPLAAKEFLASTDPWFRPVNFSIGPDGALYLLDYYRLVIEHPEWMSEAMSQPKDLNAGNDRGRIYRITPAGASLPVVKGLKLSGASTQELVTALGNPNPWWRRTAQRLLMDRKPADAKPALTQLTESSQPVARVHALWTLHGLGQLDTAVIERALGDSVAGVRENAIKLAEERLPALGEKLLALKSDPDTRVRFQLLCTLGSLDTPAARAVRDQLLEQGIEDRWMHAAALSASPAEAGRLFARSAQWTNVESKGRAALLRSIGSVIGARRNAAEVEGALARLAQAGPTWSRAAALEGIASGMKQAVASARVQQLLISLYQSPEASIRRPALRLLETNGLPSANQPLLAKAAALAGDANAPDAARADALGLLAISGAAANRALFEKLADSKQPEAVQSSAVRALGRIPGEESGKFLLKNWRGFTSAVRADAADAIYRDPARMPMILSALENGSIQAWTLGFRHKRQLQMHRDPDLRARARKVLDAAEGQRRAVIEKYQPALAEKADAGRGQQIFDNVCSKCHRLNGKGAEVGPDLATVRNQPKQVLLEDILDPNKAISQGFEAYVAETANGTIDGVMAEQTPASITLRREEGKQDVIARRDIRSLYATNLSAMPGDLEKQIDPRQMADVIEYIKSAQ